MSSVNRRFGKHVKKVIDYRSDKLGKVIVILHRGVSFTTYSGTHFMTFPTMAAAVKRSRFKRLHDCDCMACLNYNKFVQLIDIVAQEHPELTFADVDGGKVQVTGKGFRVTLDSDRPYDVISGLLRYIASNSLTWDKGFQSGIQAGMLAVGEAS